MAACSVVSLSNECLLKVRIVLIFTAEHSSWFFFKKVVSFFSLEGQSLIHEEMSSQWRRFKEFILKGLRL
jgi:hypothetical protein